MSEDQSAIDTIKRWRKLMRQELIQRRLAVKDEDHVRWSAAIDRHLSRAFRSADGLIVGFCWPHQREYDARELMVRLLANGAVCALPIVVAPKTPLVFRQWAADTPMVSDVHDIPVPVGTPQVHPDVVLAPLNGFDSEGYRLGYGGGFFDRTLAAMEKQPVAVGVGFEMARLDSIHPQPHDVPLDFIVTERGIFRTRAGRLHSIEQSARSRHFQPESELAL